MGGAESTPEDEAQGIFDEAFGEEGEWEGEGDDFDYGSGEDDARAEEGGPRSDAGEQPADLLALPRFGLRVMSVEEGSPAAEGRVVAWGDGRARTLAGDGMRGLTSFADVILSVNGVECVSLARHLFSLLPPGASRGS